MLLGGILSSFNLQDFGRWIRTYIYKIQVRRMYLCGFFVSGAVNVTDGVLSRGRNCLWWTLVINLIQTENCLYCTCSPCLTQCTCCWSLSWIGIREALPSGSFQSRGSYPHYRGFPAAVDSCIQVPSFQHVCLCILPWSLCPPIAATALLAVLWVTWPVMGASVCWHWTLGRFSRSLVSWAGQFLIQDHSEFLGPF